MIDADYAAFLDRHHRYLTAAATRRSDRDDDEEVHRAGMATLLCWAGFSEETVSNVFAARDRAPVTPFGPREHRYVLASQIFPDFDPKKFARGTKNQ